jgi:cytochrome c oxidase assembly protein subunit 20
LQLHHWHSLIGLGPLLKSSDSPMSSDKDRTPSSGASLDPLPLPPPDFTKISTEEWTKMRMPPMRGIIVDPEYPPTQEEAKNVLLKPIGDEDGEQKIPSAPSDGGSQQQQQQSEAKSLDIYRKSGASDILGRSATSKEVINPFPSGTRHTAGGEKMKDVTFTSALKTVRPGDFLAVHKQPCFRESWLYGGGAGFAVGGGMWIVGKPVMKVANFTVGITVTAACIMFTLCDSRRRKEREGVRMIVETVEEKKIERRKKLEELKKKKKKDSKNDMPTPSKPASTQATTWYRFWEARDRKPPSREG